VQSNVIQDKQTWEREYRSGNWQFLSGIGELAHNTVVAGFIHRSRKPLTLLDLGCGQGAIRQHLNMDLVTQYTGVDLAQIALDRLSPKRGNDRLVCSSVEEYQPDDKWDVVLFNEILYYTKDPVREIQKFETCLRTNGFFVISMYRKRNPLAYNNRCLRKVHTYFRQAGYKLIEFVEVRRLLFQSAWRIFVVQPPNSANHE
jgi:SAM-dependent methyltransferase